MCIPSVVAEDWVTKGFHIQVQGVEIIVYPDHEGKLGFRPFFSIKNKKRAQEADQAIKFIYRECLENPEVLKKWKDIAKNAMGNMLSYEFKDEDLANLAIGRMLEFRYIVYAIKRLEKK